MPSSKKYISRIVTDIWLNVSSVIGHVHWIILFYFIVFLFVFLRWVAFWIASLTQKPSMNQLNLNSDVTVSKISLNRTSTRRIQGSNPSFSLEMPLYCQITVTLDSYDSSRPHHFRSPSPVLLVHTLRISVLLIEEK